MTDKEINVEKLKKIIQEMHKDVSDETVESSNKKCLEEGKITLNYIFKVLQELCIIFFKMKWNV